MPRLHLRPGTKLLDSTWGTLCFSIILCAQERTVRGTHLGVSCTQPTPPLEATSPDSARCNLSFSIIFCAQESALCGTHLGLSCTQPYHRPRGAGLQYQTERGTLSFKIIFCAQERVVPRPHLSSSCTEPYHRRRGDYGGIAITDCRGLSHFLILCSSTSSARDAFRPSLHSTLPSA